MEVDKTFSENPVVAAKLHNKITHTIWGRIICIVWNILINKVEYIIFIYVSIPSKAPMCLRFEIKYNF